MNKETSNRSFAIIGGDMRQIRLANALSEMGENISVYGFDDAPYLKLKNEASLEQALKNASIIILPLPSIKQNSIINAPFSKTQIDTHFIVNQITKNQIVLAGKVDSSLQKMFEIHNIYWIDYFLREELTIANAVATAEGGISIALNEMPITLNSSKVLVTGFGRIGKILCKMLDGFGAQVTAAARKPEAFAWIDAYGYKKCNINELEHISGNFDVIFNTVPFEIITEKVLENITKDSLIIDLASKPGGVNFDAAQRLGIKTIWALSLPGRTAPVTSGDGIVKAVFNICNELGV